MTNGRNERVESKVAALRHRQAYRLSVLALVLLTVTLPIAVVVFALGASGVLDVGWFYLLFLLMVFEVLIGWVGIAGTMAAARRDRLNVTDPDYVRELMRWTVADWRSLLKSRTFA